MSNVFDPTAQGASQMVGIGDYYVRINSAKLDSTKTGTKLILVGFKIIEEGDFKGETVFDRFFLTEKSLKRLGTFCIAAGIGTFDLEDSQEIRDTFVGKTLKIKVIHENYDKNGETRVSAKPEPWNGFMKLSASEREEYPASEASDGADEPGEAAGDDDDDDDLPF